MKEITNEKVKTRLDEILEENKKIKREKDKRLDLCQVFRHIFSRFF